MYSQMIHVIQVTALTMLTAMLIMSITRSTASVLLDTSEMDTPVLLVRRIICRRLVVQIWSNYIHKTGWPRKNATTLIVNFLNIVNETELFFNFIW